jgi:hypothetical protein
MNPAPHTQLALKAALLADYTVLIDTYGQWNSKAIKFIFSTNPNLAHKIEKPTYFPGDKLKFMDYWENKLVWEKREILRYLAKKSDFSIGPQSYQAIKDAFNKWPSNYYGLFYGHSYAWTCNLYVGEALYLMGRNILNSKGNYYSASQIYYGEGPFEIIEKRDKDNKVLISIGDIASMDNGTHVEIVTQVNINSFSNDDFCSRGGGRGLGEDGKLRCNTWYTSREIDNSSIRFARLK